MAIDTITQAGGLYNSPNELSSVPKGAMGLADNIVIRNKSVVEPRPGFEPVSELPDSSGHFDKMFDFDGNILVHYGPPGNPADSLAYYTAGSETFTDISTDFEKPAEASSSRSMEAATHLHLTSSTGIKVLETLTSTLRDSGVPRAPDSPDAFATEFGAKAWMANGATCGYVTMAGRKDSDDRILLGAPSGIFYCKNASGSTAYPNIFVMLPDYEDGLFIQLYRSESVTTGSPPSNTYLVAERVVGAGFNLAIGARSRLAASSTVTVTQVAHGFIGGEMFRFVSAVADATNFPTGVYRIVYIDADHYEYDDANGALPAASSTVATAVVYRGIIIPDETPDSQLYIPNYTNSDQDGALSSNFRPPDATDITYWGDRAWYANTTAPYRRKVELLGVGATTGLQAGDTITIGGFTYTAKVGGLWPRPDYFYIATTGTPSQIIRATVKDLIYAINYRRADSVSTPRAYYNNSEDDFGTFYLENDFPYDVQFSVYSSRSSAWSPIFTAAEPVYGDNDRAPNRLFFSKTQQPEAVPLTNYLDVGSENTAIKRVVPLRDKLYVFKEEGIFTVSGEYPFRVDLFDNTAILVGEDTPALLSNQIFCLSTQGAVSISDAGVQILSRPIEDPLARLIFSDRDNLNLTAFGVGYEADRSYLLYMPTSGEEYCRQALVYNTLTSTWVRWTPGPKITNWSCGQVVDDRLYLGSAASSALLRERKFQLFQNYDGSTNLVVAAWNATTRVLTVDTTANIPVGCIVSQPGSLGFCAGIVEAVLSGTTVRLKYVQGDVFTVGENASGYEAISSSFRYSPYFANDPTLSKQFSEVQFHFRSANFYTPEVSFSSSYSARTAAETTLKFNTASYSAAVSLPSFSLPVPPPVLHRVIVPREQQYATSLVTGLDIVSYNRWTYLGITYKFSTADTADRSVR